MNVYGTRRGRRLTRFPLPLAAMLPALLALSCGTAALDTAEEEASARPAPGASPAEEPAPPKPEDDWISLFDGESLDGWKASENAASFSVRDGVIVAKGPRSHLFYVGPVEDHDFRNFEFKAEVLTKPGANSGLYFHTRYQDGGWPSKGYEAQINNTQSDWRKTGSLYGVKDVRVPPAKDDVWFTEHVIVKGKRIEIRVDGKTVVEYTEPDDVKRGGRVLSSGTFALQGHDPGSEVHFRNIKVKPLPD